MKRKMMRKTNLWSMLLCLLATTVVAQNSGSTVVHTFHKKTIVTDPSKGENSYKTRGVFPKASAAVRRMTLQLTLGSPDEMPTAHWDYCDVISIRRKGGVHGEDKRIEIGRMLTPYGSIFGKGWQWMWEVDVTDFQHLLRDSVEIEYLHTGYEPNTVGWALTMDVAVQFGPSIAPLLGMQPLWNGKFKYGDSTAPFAAAVMPVRYTAPAQTSFSRVRIQHTGHGADKPRNCSEFCSRWRQILHDGKLADKRDMWKECSDNALYPQGGTWIYDRAYWCPGDLQRPDVIDMPAKAGTHQVDLQMEPYTATGNVQAYEHIGSYLFYYGEPTHQHDVLLEDIVAPSNKQAFTRYNPAINNASIIVRNVGSQPLKSLTIVYGTVGVAQKTYQWKGLLPFNQTVMIALPGAVDMLAKDNQFTVMLSQPNGKADAWPADNSLTTTYKAPITLPNVFVLKYKTNNRPADNFIALHNAAGEKLFEKLPSTAVANTEYNDTISLKEGFHRLQLTDTSGNGLQFWAQPQQGDGFLRLYDTTGRLLYVFESDCGAGEALSFYASPQYKPDTVNIQAAFSMFPRRTKDNIQLDIELSTAAKVAVKITVDGILHQLHEYRSIRNGKFTYSLLSLPQGRFVVDVYVNDVRKFTGRVNRD